MKRLIFIIICGLIGASVQLSAQPQNRWSIYGGGSLSHLCEDVLFYTDDYGWGGGAFLGGGYEINFTPHWSLTPQVELAYMDNGAKLDIPDFNAYLNRDSWRDAWSVSIPVMAGFRFGLSNHVGMKVSAGPYLYQAFASRQYQYGTTRKESAHGSFSDNFNIGVIGEVAVETGRHFSYMFRTQYPFLKETWSRKTITLSLGVRYSF